MRLSGREQLVEFRGEGRHPPGMAACIWAFDRDKTPWPVAAKLRAKLDSSKLP